MKMKKQNKKQSKMSDIQLASKTAKSVIESSFSAVDFLLHVSPEQYICKKRGLRIPGLVLDAVEMAVIRADQIINDEKKINKKRKKAASKK